MWIFVVFREEGLRSDGYYYESKTSVIGSRKTKEEAYELLFSAATHFHPNEIKTCDSTADECLRIRFDIGCDDLEDVFWVEPLIVGKKGDSKLLKGG